MTQRCVSCRGIKFSVRNYHDGGSGVVQTVSVWAVLSGRARHQRLVSGSGTGICLVKRV